MALFWNKLAKTITGNIRVEDNREFSPIPLYTNKNDHIANLEYDKNLDQWIYKQRMLGDCCYLTHDDMLKIISILNELNKELEKN